LVFVTNTSVACSPEVIQQYVEQQRTPDG